MIDYLRNVTTFYKVKQTIERYYPVQGNGWRRIFSGLVLLLCFSLVACTNVQHVAASSTTTTNPVHGASSKTLSVQTSKVSMLPTEPLLAIRMLDPVNGWALTAHAVLRTSDGGQHWRAVTPPANAINAASTADFLNYNLAWIASPPFFSNPQGTTRNVTILYTRDGGAHWQTSIIHDQQAVGADRPHFINALEGWIEIGAGAAMSQESVDIFHSLDGGVHWSRIATTGTGVDTGSGLSLAGDKTGISFKDSYNGWATAYTPATDHPWLYRTRDGGHTWFRQSLPLMKGFVNSEYNTFPPVFFGNTGFLPAQVDTLNVRGTVLYVTHDGGNSWTPTQLTGFSANNVYVIDLQHAWAADARWFYETADAGLHWRNVATTPATVTALSFADSFNCWAIGFTDSNPPLLLHTSDGGHNWQRISYTIYR